METTKLTAGARIYNHGDMANPSHFGTIVEVRKSSQWGANYLIAADDGEGTYSIPASMVCDEFKGHSGTRIVTETTYQDWKAERMKAFTDRAC